MTKQDKKIKGFIWESYKKQLILVVWWILLLIILRNAPRGLIAAISIGKLAILIYLDLILRKRIKNYIRFNKRKKATSKAASKNEMLFDNLTNKWEELQDV